MKLYRPGDEELLKLGRSEIDDSFGDIKIYKKDSKFMNSCDECSFDYGNNNTGKYILCGKKHFTISKLCVIQFE